MSSKQSEEAELGCRRVFLRLHEDMSEVINDAVDYAKSQGLNQTKIAERMGVDKSFLTRLIQGESGTTLRTIGALLYATDCRVRVEMVPCERLKEERYGHQVRGEKYFVTIGNVWETASVETPSRTTSEPGNFKVIKTKSRPERVD